MGPTDFSVPTGVKVLPPLMLPGSSNAPGSPRDTLLHAGAAAGRSGGGTGGGGEGVGTGRVNGKGAASEVRDEAGVASGGSYKSSALSGQTEAQRRQEKHANSLRERHDKLVRMLGEESADQIWEEMTRSAHSTPSQQQGSEFGSKGGMTSSSAVVTVATTTASSSSPSSVLGVGARKHSRRSASLSGTDLLSGIASSGGPSPPWSGKADANGGSTHRNNAARGTLLGNSSERAFGSNGGGSSIAIGGTGVGGGDGGGGAGSGGGGCGAGSGAGAGGGLVHKSSHKASKFPYRKRLREGLDAAYQSEYLPPSHPRVPACTVAAVRALRFFFLSRPRNEPTILPSCRPATSCIQLVAWWCARLWC